MRIFREPFPKLNNGIASVALGTFDGLHSGHLSVIGSAVDKAKTLNGEAAVWCFSSPPKNALDPGTALPLMTPDEKADAISALGVDILIMPNPTPELLSMDADEFVRKLVSALSPASAVCGFNFTFGKNASGNQSTLARQLGELGIPVSIIPPVLNTDGTPISSTLLRKKLTRN